MRQQGSQMGQVKVGNVKIKITAFDYQKLQSAFNKIELLKKQSEADLKRDLEKVSRIVHTGTSGPAEAIARVEGGKLMDWKLLKMPGGLSLEEGLKLEFRCRKEIRKKNHEEVRKVYDKFNTTKFELIKLGDDGVIADGYTIKLDRNQLALLKLDKRKEDAATEAKQDELKERYEALKDKEYKAEDDSESLVTITCHIHDGEACFIETKESKLLLMSDYNNISSAHRKVEDKIFNMYYADIAKMHSEIFNYEPAA